MAGDHCETMRTRRVAVNARVCFTKNMTFPRWSEAIAIVRLRGHLGLRIRIMRDQNIYRRNYNSVRHESKRLGTTSFTIIVAMLVLVVGLIYVTQGTRATDYDYRLSEIETELDELEAEREDLAVERARLTSIAASEGSTVAQAMEEAKPGGYAE